MKREETVDYNIKAAWHAIARMYNQEAVKHDITTSIGFVLLNIDAEQGTPATKIAPLLGLEARSLTRMLKSMEEKGLIFRQADPVDRRLVRIFLTEEGKRKKEVSRRTVKSFNQAVQDTIPADKLKCFYDVINQINRIVDEHKFS
ncbi:MarR family winged helix-turn-helix transcriptional regulator [Cesiribacter andamanensis]|uniref:Accessory regulator Z n=1 Tax=Cesiribacter andamanensis AMV16 TaxID=1279009 RepID=M7N7Z8_9BACT|nr:MarR family transcriptional regulator [Cesiribacter andamanensis]EMR04723.1 accessory regulator Z [Cesiribacter andamanensis AMV16]